MRTLRAALGLLLLGALWAFPQDRALKDACARDPGRYYDKAAGQCCYRCPSGLSPTQPCPQGSADCRKQCEPDYYLNRDGRCTACVSCSTDDLVEKRPCSWNSSRVCECRPGMFCATSAANSCARCQARPACPPGMASRFPGTAKDAECEPPSPATSPACSSPEDCKAPPRGTAPQAKPSLRSPATSSTRTTLLTGATPPTPEDASRPPRTDPPSTMANLGIDPDPGSSPTPTQLCPQGSPSCRKQCQPDHYLDANGRCMACVSCLRDDLVEKRPCSWNSSRVCECRPGMFCATSAANSCARCQARPACPPGMAIDPQEIPAESDATPEPPPPGTLPDCSSPEDSGAPASTATLSSQLDPHTRSSSTPGSSSSTRKPTLDPGPVLFCVILVLVAALGSGSFLLCHRRACRKRIWQKLHRCYSAQTFRPAVERADSRRWRNPESSSTVVAELGPEPAVETCPLVGTALVEDLPLLNASPAGGPSPSWELPEPRVSTEHTNNKIEKIYIMKADTVIVGTVKAEVPEGWGVAGPTEPQSEELEVDHAPHYPEQETEPPLGSCGDVTFSVEEEGKEDPLPSSASGK
uniref:TNF receptor superfamily member 8 n=1 Tax=Oryctolagus cuniculus TaxID=9986 RepID=G1TAJ2_RABIT|nr:tumor necrosis factor receptor superfamily member 8 isoform X1 [Oryctolagus cuniculus]